MIKTWNERCVGHPDHQTGITTERMIMRRMQEEIAELRAALAQPERKPLTDEEMDKLFGYETERGAVPGPLAVAFVRIVERAHGIGEHNA